MSLIGNCGGITDFGCDDLIIQDEGISLGTAGTINFVGSGVTASVVNGVGTITISGGGGGGSPGGSDTQVQFNDGGAFGGDAGFTYNKTTDTVTTGILNLTAATNQIIFDSDGSFTGTLTMAALGTNRTWILPDASGTLITTGSSPTLNALTVTTINGGTISGNNSGDQTIILTGDVTGSGTGSFATTISNSSVTLAKIANATANSKLLGSGASGSGSPYSEITLGTNLSMSGTTLNATGGGGSPGGSTTQVQFNDAGSFGGASQVNIEAGGNLNLDDVAYNTAIATPTTSLTVFDRLKGSKQLLSYLDSDGIESSSQPHFGFKNVRMAKTVPGSSAFSLFGLPTVTSTGTASALNPSNSSFYTQFGKIRYSTAAAINSTGGFKFNQPLCYPGNGSDIGGFYMAMRFGCGAYRTGSSALYGIAASATVFSATAEASTNTNFLAVGFDSTDSNLQIMYNDASGTATKVNLGSNFPFSNTNTDVYEIRIYTTSASGANWGWYIERLNTGDKAEGVASTDLPSGSTSLSPQINITTLAGTVVAFAEINSVYLETNY